jgi:hypothetical protein
VNKFVNHSVKRIAFVLPQEIAAWQQQNSSRQAEGVQPPSRRTR